MKSLTYKQIVDIFETTSINNLNVESFYLNEIWEIGQDNNVLYPAVYFEQPSLINVANRIETLSIAFNVVDRSLEDLSERKKVLSKLKQIGESIIAYIRKNYPDLISGDDLFSYSALPFQEAQLDRVWGWRFELNINNLRNLSECELPYNSEL